MKHDIVVQYANHERNPSQLLLKRWANAALAEQTSSVELTIRIVDLEEMTMLNSTYRKKNKPTNVLSFPFDMPNVLTDSIKILGDIVICSPVIKKEALEQNKHEKSHWAHMVIHGVLHLLGYDHVNEDDAIKMESLEIKILSSLHFPNPYQLIDSR